MTIQGIITGFCDPENNQNNVILIGSGAEHIIIKDGKIVDSVSDFDDALKKFSDKSKQIALKHWVSVRGLTSSNVGTSTVTHTGQRVFGDYQHFGPEENN